MVELLAAVVGCWAVGVRQASGLLRLFGAATACYARWTLQILLDQESDRSCCPEHCPTVQHRDFEMQRWQLHVGPPFWWHSPILR